MDLAREEALARHEPSTGPDGMEPILSDDGNQLLGTSAAPLGASLHQRFLTTRRSRVQAPDVRIVDYGRSRHVLQMLADGVVDGVADGGLLSEGERPGTMRPPPM